jgi:3-phenylpropionate/trans-cinnamate dioxygenase ferredoxin reductase subunit
MGVVIVGAGQAGFQVAASLRTEGYLESITLIGEEPHLPYQRPPLSKGFLEGKQTIDHTVLRPEAFFLTQRIELITGHRVTAIDRVASQVELASGTRLRYDQLVLATGARPRELPAGSVIYLRTRADAVELRERLGAAATIAVIGGGFIGLEVAAAAQGLGKSVTVFELQDRLMSRCVSPLLSEFYRRVHTDHDVRIVLGTPATPQADLLLAGIGVIPNVELAEGAGLSIGNGILVDQHLRTSDPQIFAIGDCANHPNEFAGGRARLESVQNAVDQAKCAAANIAGRGVPFHAVPWFWTDQFDIKLQMAGLSAGADQEILRGDPETRKFSVFYFRGGRLIAIDSINRPGDHMVGRKLLAAGSTLPPAQASDESLDLKSLV